MTARVAFFATLLVVLAGLPLARALSLLQRRGPAARRGVAVFETFALLPLVLPPTTLGYFLLVLLGRRSPVGRLADALGHPLVFELSGAVVAAAVAAFPLFFEPVKAGFDAVDPALEDAARLLGAGEPFVLLRIKLPLAARSVLAGTALAFARAVGDFGTTLMVAGSIPGRTQTVSIAIYEAVEAGEEKPALLLCLFVALFALSALGAARLARAGRAEAA